MTRLCSCRLRRVMRDIGSRAWHVLDSWRGDAIATVLLIALLLSVLAAAGQLSGPGRPFQAACAAGVCACLLLRRAWPPLAALGAAGILGVAGAAGPAAGDPFALLFVVIFLLAYSLGAGTSLVPSILTVALLCAGLQIAVAQFNPFVVIITVGPWAAGLVARSRRQLTEQLTIRGAELEAERELFAAESVRYERARIARELHDIVAHGVSVMVIQASAGRRLAATDPASAAEAFDSISQAARQAETEISRLVELLDYRPQPGSADGLRLIDELVARAGATGLRVTCRFAGSAEGLPSAMFETAYRLIQESLTNALKHAPGAPVEITIQAAEGHITIRVVNGPAAATPSWLERTGGSRGLVGLRERAAACGGDLTAGPTGDGGWEVLATLPVQPGPADARAADGQRPLAAEPRIG